MSFKIKLGVRITYLFLFLIFFGMALWLNPLRFITLNGDVFDLLSGTLFSCLFFFVFLFALWGGIHAYAIQKAVLIVDDDHIEFRTAQHLNFLIPAWLKPFSFKFDDIVSVKAGKQLFFWEITSLSGKTVNMSPNIFKKQDAEKILNLLHLYVSKDRVEPGLEIFDPKKRENYNLLLVVGTITLLVLFLTFLLDGSFPVRARLNKAWYVEMRFPVLESPAWIFSVETQDKFWMVANDFGHPYRVYNQNGKQTRTWDLPELPGNDYPQLISSDINGNPIVWFENRTLHHKNNQWETIFYEEGVDFSGIRYNRGVVSGEHGWFIAEKDVQQVLVHLNAVTGEWQEISLPERANEQGLTPSDVKNAINGDLLVLLTSQTEAWVYINSNNVWQDRAYSIIVSENQRVQDYFIDIDGTLWALVGNFEDQLIEKISSTGEVKLTFLPKPLADQNDIDNYENLVVDSRGRLWLNGGYPHFLCVFMPQWNQHAKQLVVYTTENSNYQGDSPLTYFANELIFSGDDYISSINANVEELPAPLPDWLAKLDINIVRLVAQVIFLLFGLLNLNLYKNPHYNRVKVSSL